MSRFGRLPPAETDSFLLMTGVDVEGRRDTRCFAGAVVGGGGAGAGGGAFLAGAGFASSGGGRFLIDLSNSSKRLPISEIACPGPLNLTQFEKTSRTSAINCSVV